MADPLLVYLHVPFCRSKCHFCDWVTGISPSDLRLAPADERRRAYIAALVKQIHAHGDKLVRSGYQPRILYWGGGTASALNAAEFATVMAALHRMFCFDDLVEATMECSPESLSAEKLALYRAAGFNRLSIGVQSMDDSRLRKIGRAHDAATAATSLRLAREAGFDDVNIDLICGFPDETVEEFDASLDQALALPFNHCSLYPYRPAQGTVMVRQMHKNRLGRTWLDEQLAAYEHGRVALEKRGRSEYAMSHFGAPACHSDLAYFRLDMDWIGFGAGATSLYQGRYRATERGQLARYNADPIRVDEDVAAHSPHIVSRLAYQALTTCEGIERRRFETRLGASLESLLAQPALADLLTFFDRLGVLRRDTDAVRIKPGKIADAFIRLLFLNTPKTAQRRTTANVLVGGY